MKFLVKNVNTNIFNIIEYKAYLFGGVEINWKCHPSLISDNSKIKNEIKLCFKNGLSDYIHFKTASIPLFIGTTFKGSTFITTPYGSVGN